MALNNAGKTKLACNFAGGGARGFCDCSYCALLFSIFNFSIFTLLLVFSLHLNEHKVSGGDRRRHWVLSAALRTPETENSWSCRKLGFLRAFCCFVCSCNWFSCKMSNPKTSSSILKEFCHFPRQVVEK